jgi:integrase
VAGRALNDDELAAVLAAAEEIDPSTATMVSLMARCGLRIGEVLALRRSDVDLVAGLLRIERSLSRREGMRPVKGRTSEEEGRTVPIPADAGERVRRHLAESGGVLSIDGLLFTTRTGRPLSYTTWRSRRWRRIVKRAGVGEVRPSDMRHTAATRLYVVDRWTPAEVQSFLGHSDPRLALAIYTHIDASSLPTPSALPHTGGS